MSMAKFLNTEGAIIASMLGANKIHARIEESKCIYKDSAAGFVRYSLILREDQRFDAIERIQRELSSALSQGRRNMGLPSPIQAIPVGSPSFAIEVPHPYPKSLLWSPRSITTTPVNTMLLGRSYNGTPVNELISLTSSDSCHALIVGITGAGKTMLMQNMLLSLCAGTSPDELKIVLIDLKNEDMLPFRSLPHVLTFAGTKDAAAQAIEYVYNEKEKRVAQEGYKPFRLVLWIDEMAQLASMKNCAVMLEDLAGIGRTKAINLVGATQHPTEKGGLGGVLKANFPVRLVGMVSPGQSHVATGRPRIRADLLPGKGSFLRCQGPQVTRFQSYFIEPNDVISMVNHIAGTWNKSKVKPYTDQPPIAEVQAISIKAEEPVDVLFSVVKAFDVGNGEMRRGFMSAAVTALNGGTIPTGTTFLRLKSKVETYLLTYLQKNDSKIIRFPMKKTVNG